MKYRCLSFFPILGLAFILSACSPGGVPLAGDQVLESLCPESGCADATPDQNQLSIKGPGATNMQSKVVSGDFVEFGGDCYASTYPNNRIRVYLYNNSGTPITLGASDVISVFQSSTEPRCIQGRYNFVINGAKLGLVNGANHVYRVKAEIVGIDANGNEYSNSNTGLFQVWITRHN